MADDPHPAITHRHVAVQESDFDLGAEVRIAVLSHTPAPRQ